MSSVVKNIKKLSLTVLGCEAEPWDNVWSRVKDLADAFGAARVSEVFEEWALSRQGEMLRKPVEDFLKFAPGLLQGITNLKPDPKLQELINGLALVSEGRVTFDREQQIEIGRLAKEWPATDILSVFRTFCGDLDEFAVRFGAKNFIEKSGQLLYVQKRRKQVAAATDKLIQDLTAKEQADQAAREAVRLAKKAEEASLVEDTL